MHYLEDDLDLLEGVPERLKQQSLEMRELDARIQKINEELNINSREFFNIMSTLTAEEKERTFNKLREDYQTIRLMSQKKVDIAENMQLMLEKYQERIAKDLIEFKYELETDTPGVTETIEKDLCERIKNYNYEDSVRPSTSNMNFSAQRINGQRHFITDSEQYHQRGALNEPSSSSGRRRQAFVDDSSLDETYVPNTKKKVPNSANSDRDSQHQRKAFLKKLTGRRSTISSRDPSPIINSAISLNFIGDKGNQTTRFPFPNKNTPSTRDGGVEKGSTVYRASINTYSTTHHNTTNTTTSSTNFPLSKNSLQNYNAEGGSTTTTTSSIIIKPNQLSPSIALGTSSSYSQQQQQSSNSITPITTNSTMPTFVDGSESQYGRTVKLTSRVQQMLKDRQTHHRMGRPPGGAHFVASQPPQPIQQQPPSAFSKQQQSRNSITSNLNRPLKQEPEQIASRSYLDDDDFVMEEDEDERGGGGGGDQFSLPDDEEEDDHHHHIEEEEEEENNNNNDDDDDEDLRSMTLLEEEDENEEEIEEEEEELEDNRTWCICQKKSEGDMVACDNKACPFEWFHYGCVGITAPPKGKWFCPECIKKRSRSQSQELLLNH